MLVQKQETLERDMKVMKASQEEQGAIGNGDTTIGYGNKNNNNNEVDTNAVEDKQAAAATANDVDEPIETSA